MLQARKEALRNNARVGMLAIRDSELRLYVRNVHQLGTGAALLAGFAYSGLYYHTKACFGLGGQEGRCGLGGTAPGVTDHAYILALTVTMGCALQTVLITQVVSMMGPGLALRGPDGSFAIAVDNVRSFYAYALLLFLVGMLCMVCSALLFCWSHELPTAGRVVATGLCISTVLGGLHYTRVARQVFRVPRAGGTTGSFGEEGEGEEEQKGETSGRRGPHSADRAALLSAGRREASSSSGRAAVA